MVKVTYKNLGLIDYKEAWDLQEELFAENIQPYFIDIFI